ncbi:hypothetical protein INR49_026683 [Caranx melampygus]|nr:hypothetical protein INR49_026683 [Caranx melampygus]
MANFKGFNESCHLSQTRNQDHHHNMMRLKAVTRVRIFVAKPETAVEQEDMKADDSVVDLRSCSTKVDTGQDKGAAELDAHAAESGNASETIVGTSGTNPFTVRSQAQ